MQTSADEFSNQKNNSAFTNGGFSVALKRTIELAQVLNVTVPSNWSEIADKITVLTDPASDVTLEFEGYNATIEVKQADVVLLTYPFGEPSNTASFSTVSDHTSVPQSTSSRRLPH